MKFVIQIINHKFIFIPNNTFIPKWMIAANINSIVMFASFTFLTITTANTMNSALLLCFIDMFIHIFKF